MGWLAVAKALFRIADGIIKRLNRDQLVELGRDREVKNVLENTLELVRYGERVDGVYDDLSAADRRRLRRRYGPRETDR